MRVVIFASSREAEMEEPVLCDRDSVKVDASKCSGKTLSIATPLSRYFKDLGFYVIVVDPFAEDGDYDADEIIKGTAFTIPDDMIKDNYVIVATRHVYDTWAIMKSIQAKAKSISVVMSIKRARVILKRIIQAGIAKEYLKSLRIPAGLDIGAKTDKEIALSIVAEILAIDRNGSALPLREIKGFEKMVDEL
ncbi:XdhC family protein [Acidianus sulfidivorans JP7]|uniref:Xanthine dehydrogenase n=1 Tax=Acidianus sulfidivorans JP7 TaxID=619593 RepID=A0A2U9IN16_9CREN|nr:XdhC family protein [Acidianus sulfidivorans]AWR97423.1 XdhC family protein [Acidianus sulfidivorans JP7]